MQDTKQDDKLYVSLVLRRLLLTKYPIVNRLRGKWAEWYEINIMHRKQNIIWDTRFLLPEYLFHFQLSVRVYRKIKREENSFHATEHTFY